MSLVDKFKYSSTSAVNTFKNSWMGYDYLRQSNVLYSQRLRQYEIMQAAYDNTIFINVGHWKHYLRERDLHEKTICSLLNPTKYVVSFYAAMIYSGTLSPTGYPVANNQPLAVPLSDLTTPEQRAAIGQLWMWSNWKKQMPIWIKNGAMLGDTFAEIVDDIDAGKVYAQIVRPEFITDFKWNEMGEIIYYKKEIRDIDEKTGEVYVYRRDVDREKICTYKNGAPWKYNGLPEEYENPYGFCPIVMVKHEDPGLGIFPGTPAVPLGTWRKIEELNSDFTRVRLYIRKLAYLPQILGGMGEITPPKSELDMTTANLEDFFLLEADTDGTVHKLEGNLSISDALAAIKQQIDEIHRDLPEYVAYDKMAKQSQTTGPATENMLGDVITNVKRAAENYDNGTIELFSKCMAIAGMRANQEIGGWAAQTDAQKKFLPFGINDYADGNLEFGVEQRNILEISEYDKATTELQEYLAIATGVRAGIPWKYQMIRKGVPQTEIDKIEAYQKEALEQELDQQKKVAEITAIAKVPKGQPLQSQGGALNGGVKAASPNPDAVARQRSMESMIENGNQGKN